MLIIFDVDGTLIGGEADDWKCFADAFLHVTGSAFRESFWKEISEITGKAIVHQALPGHSAENRAKIEEAVRTGYLERLKAVHARDNRAFSPMPGAVQALEYLDAQPGIEVAIATGDWHDSITFKLAAAGIDVSRYPMATSSDHYARADIIRLAAERAGRNLDDAIYIGDGPWDFRACRQLGIPFLGVGRRHAEFLESGAVHALPSLDPDGFTAWFTQFCVDKRCYVGRPNA